MPGHEDGCAPAIQVSHVLNTKGLTAVPTLCYHTPHITHTKTAVTGTDYLAPWCTESGTNAASAITRPA
ncbi:MAG: hypothetical protein H6660_05575 [Ardenticatenaceae bacterium]|nr:hypothetical protein [Ardenticatenaceae bacterium]